MQQTLIERLRIRANIRRNAVGRKSVEEGMVLVRIADLLEESADELERLERLCDNLSNQKSSKEL